MQETRGVGGRLKFTGMCIKFNFPDTLGRRPRVQEGPGWPTPPSPLSPREVVCRYRYLNRTIITIKQPLALEARSGLSHVSGYTCVLARIGLYLCARSGLSQRACVRCNAERRQH